MNKFTFQQLVDAHKSADKSLLTIELSNPPRVRFRVTEYSDWQNY